MGLITGSLKAHWMIEGYQLEKMDLLGALSYQVLYSNVKLFLNKIFKNEKMKKGSKGF